MMTVTIQTVGSKGDGLAFQHESRVAIPFALPGEVVEISPIDGDRATLLSITTPSPDRVDPFCKHFGTCGGCALQHWSQSAYQVWKRDLVMSALEREGITTIVEPLVAAHGVGRRRVTLHVRFGEGGAKAGFMAAKSHKVVDLDTCPILVPALATAPDIARQLAGPLRRAGPLAQFARGILLFLCRKTGLRRWW